MEVSKTSKAHGYEFELCFFPIPGSFVRLKGNEQLYDKLDKIEYRCGACGKPVNSLTMTTHFDEHRNALIMERK